MAVHSANAHIHPLRPQQGDGNMETRIYGNTVVNIHYDKVLSGEKLEQALDELHEAAWDIIDELIEQGEAV